MIKRLKKKQKLNPEPIVGKLQNQYDLQNIFQKKSQELAASVTCENEGKNEKIL